MEQTLNNDTIIIDNKEVKKTVLRQVLLNWEYSYNRLNSSDNKLSLKELFSYSTISEIKGTQQPTWFINEGRCNFCVVYKDTETFKGYELVKDFVLKNLFSILVL